MSTRRWQSCKSPLNKPLAVAATWLVGVTAVCVGGLFPDEYRAQVLRLAGPQPYPLHGVAQFVLAVTVETAVLGAFLGPGTYRGSWGRALAAALLFLPVTLYFGAALMHAPTYQYMHFLWSAALSVALVAVLARSAVTAARRRPGP